MLGFPIFGFAPLFARALYSLRVVFGQCCLRLPFLHLLCCRRMPLKSSARYPVLWPSRWSRGRCLLHPRTHWLRAHWKMFIPLERCGHIACGLAWSHVFVWCGRVVHVLVGCWVFGLDVSIPQSKHWSAQHALLTASIFCKSKWLGGLFPCDRKRVFMIWSTGGECDVYMHTACFCPCSRRPVVVRARSFLAGAGSFVGLQWVFGCSPNGSSAGDGGDTMAVFRHREPSTAPRTRCARLGCGSDAQASVAPMSRLGFGWRWQEVVCVRGSLLTRRAYVSKPDVYQRAPCATHMVEYKPSSGVVTFQSSGVDWLMDAYFIRRPTVTRVF